MAWSRCCGYAFQASRSMDWSHPSRGVSTLAARLVPTRRRVFVSPVVSSSMASENSRLADCNSPAPRATSWNADNRLSICSTVRPGPTTTRATSDRVSEVPLPLLQRWLRLRRRLAPLALPCLHFHVYLLARWANLHSRQ